MRRWTEAQQRAIDARGNVIVSAAAGAGKTAVLTERLTQLVAAGTPVDRLLVLTFTRAAATEMKQRMEKRLRTAAAEAGDPEKQAYLRAQAGALGRAYISTVHAFCARVLRRHGHLLDLPPSVRVLDELETPVVVGRVRDALLTRLGAEEDADYRTLLAAFGGEDAAWAAVQQVAAFLQSQPEPARFLDDAARRYDDPQWMARTLQAVTDEARAALCAAVQTLERARDALPPDWAGAIGTLDDELLQLRGVLLQTEYDAYRAGLLAFERGRLTFPRGTAEADKAPAQAARKAVKACVDAQRAQFFRPAAEERALLLGTGGVVRALRAVVLQYEAAFAAEKRRLGAVDYADLEHMALKLLQMDAVAAEYRERFCYIAVDEYQDSNRVQEALLEAVRREDNLFFVGDVKQSIYRFRQAEPALFLEKLARFDGAHGTRIDLTSNFRSAPDVLESVNDVFRAILTPETGELAYDARAALVPGRAGLSGGTELHLIERALAGAPEEDAPEEDAQQGGAGAGADEPLEDLLDAEVEARLVARRIRALMAGGTVPDRETGQARPLRYGDFAVLLRTRTHAAHFAATLAQEGIPSYAQLSGGYFDSVEVLLALNLLRVVDNRRQDIPLLSVLRATGAGDGAFSGAELARIRAAHPDGTFFDALEAMAAGAGEAGEAERAEPAGAGEKFGEDAGAQAGTAGAAETAGARGTAEGGGAGEPVARGADAEAGDAADAALARRCAAFLARVAAWRAESRLVPVEALLARLYDETGLYAEMGALVGGAERQANLDALLARARAFEAGPERGVAAFLRFMDHSKEGNADLGAAQAVGADVVRILTIHRSKGLEFPVVFLCELGRRFRLDGQREDLLLHAAGGIGLRWIDGGVKRDTAARRALQQRLRREQLAEEMRVLYVGMTRAEHRLVLIGSWKNAARLLAQAEAHPTPAQVLACTAPLQWALMGTRAHCDTRLHAREPLLAAAPASGRTAPLEAPGREAAEALARRLAWRYPFSAAAALPAKAAVSDLARRMGAAAAEPPAFDPPRFLPAGAPEAAAALTAAERGTAVHAVLAGLPLVPMEEADVRAHVEALVRAGRLTAAQAAAVPCAALSWLTRTPLYGRMAASVRVERELPFSHAVPAAALFGAAAGAEPVLLQGVIDCCFLTDAGWVLVDYKTDRVPPGEPAARQAAAHAPQLRLYAGALAQLTGLPVAERLVVLLSARAIEPVPADAPEPA